MDIYQKKILSPDQIPSLPSGEIPITPNQQLLTEIQRRTGKQYNKFNFEALSTVPLPYLVDAVTEQKLYNIASSIKYNANIKKKSDTIIELMRPLGFIKFHAGTNRIAFRHVNIDDIILKVALDDSGLRNASEELESQQYIKPFCTKIFDASPSGVIELSERVVPIRSKLEFSYVWEDVFHIITDKLIGRVVLDDFGTDYFMNWGLRKDFGPVLLDFPYVYPIDEAKVFCNKPDPRKYGLPCGGVIDYDAGFNKIKCTWCGAVYNAKDLWDRNAKSRINLVKENIGDMKIQIIKEGKVIYESPDEVVPVCNLLPPSKGYKGKSKPIPVGDKLKVVASKRTCSNKNMISEERKESVKLNKYNEGLLKITEKYANDIERERAQLEALKQEYTADPINPEPSTNINNNLDQILQQTKAAILGSTPLKQESMIVSDNQTVYGNMAEDNDHKSIPTSNYNVYSYSSVKDDNKDTNAGQITIQDDVPEVTEPKKSKRRNPIKIVSNKTSNEVTESKSINNDKNNLDKIIEDYESNNSNDSRPAKKQKSKRKDKAVITADTKSEQIIEKLPTINIPKEEIIVVESTEVKSEQKKPNVIVIDPNNIDLEINFLYNKSILPYYGSED